MKIHDISLLVEEEMVIYPGDPEVIIKRYKKNQNGWNLSNISMGSHTGTHVDTLLHIKDGADGVESIPLDKCYGICKVLDLSEIPFGEGIQKFHLEKFEINKNDIILIKTINSTTDYKEFREDFVFLTDSAANFLAKKKIKTIGIDYLSVGSRETHEKLLQNGIMIFEGLILRNIQPKEYIFIGLPIKIKTEGAPARVILIEK
ncbi:MAG: cyclase family protein [Promethearchaeota archaeon]|nr:MAG: cyclase family protein [Candidatus Lokiarchaeota archaeon]